MKCPYCFNEAKVVESIGSWGWHIALDCLVCCCITASGRFAAPGNETWGEARLRHLKKLAA